MEQSRLLLAIGLSFLVIFVWSLFFTEKPTVTQEPDTTVSEKVSTDGKTEIATDSNATAKRTPVQPIAAKPLKPGRSITVETPLYRMRFSERGATVTSVVLKKYRETVENDSPLKEVLSPDLAEGAITVDFLNQSGKGLGQTNFVSDAAEDLIAVQDQEKKLRFQVTRQDGVIVEKEYTFVPQSYEVGLKVIVHNGSDRDLRDRLTMTVSNKVVAATRAYGFEGPSALVDNSLERVKIKKIEDHEGFKGNIKWLAIEDRYFMTSLVAKEAAKGRLKLAVNDDHIIENQLILSEAQIPPSGVKQYDFDLFIGPKSLSILKAMDENLAKAINFGWFDIIAKPCLWFMNLIYSVIPNYGIAIILLTLVTKIILWPLGTKSYKSMNAMKKLQPLMAEIREKHKNDKTKMNQELMALYKTYKINPMGGCLPMFLQIPVFFALYRMLYQAIELRHAPFVFWINDLSAPDRLFRFGFHIPMMEPPYGIPVLTLVMGATMFLQQKMSPPPGDPTQAKMMMFMPIVFTFIFINFSSGLVLYWMVNNLFSIAQQYYTQVKKA